MDIAQQRPCTAYKSVNPTIIELSQSQRTDKNKICLHMSCSECIFLKNESEMVPGFFMRCLHWAFNKYTWEATQFFTAMCIQSMLHSLLSRGQKDCVKKNLNKKRRKWSSSWFGNFEASFYLHISRLTALHLCRHHRRPSPQKALGVCDGGQGNKAAKSLCCIVTRVCRIIKMSSSSTSLCALSQSLQMAEAWQCSVFVALKSKCRCWGVSGFQCGPVTWRWTSWRPPGRCKGIWFSAAMPDRKISTKSSSSLWKTLHRSDRRSPKTGAPDRTDSP